MHTLNTNHSWLTNQSGPKNPKDHWTTKQNQRHWQQEPHQFIPIQASARCCPSPPCSFWAGRRSSPWLRVGKTTLGISPERHDLDHQILGWLYIHVTILPCGWSYAKTKTSNGIFVGRMFIVINAERLWKTMRCCYWGEQTCKNHLV